MKPQAAGQTQTLTNTDLQVPNLPLTANLNLDVAARGHQDPGVILCSSYRSRVPLQQTYLAGVTNPLDRAAVIFFFFSLQSLQAERVPGYR